MDEWIKNDGILFSHKKERHSDTRYNMDKPQKHYANTKVLRLHDSIYMKFPE